MGSTENKSFSTKISQQKEEIVNKSAAIEKYKKAIARRKESPLNIATKPDPTPTTNSGNTADSTTNNKASHGGTRFVDHEIEYSSLLQQTIQSLRRKVVQLTMTKKLTNCQLNLKPLNF